MAENGANDEGSGTDSKGIEELSSKTLRIQNKRYYIDAKRNSRGTFVKLVEALPNGVKTRLSIPMIMVGEFRDKLSSMADFYTSLDPAQGREPTEDGALKSSSIRGTGKRVYLDLMENNRGIFLRVSVLNRGQNRHTIALPARGIVDIRNTLSEYLEEFGSEEEVAELPDPQEMKVERKRFYFDCGRNSRGSFLRISEVTSNYRSSITIPRQGLQKFRNLVAEACDVNLSAKMSDDN